MAISDAQPMPSLGADIRALRRRRGLTLAQLAETLDRSVGWMSQVERDLSAPSTNDLGDLAAALGVSVAMLAQPTGHGRSQETGHGTGHGPGHEPGHDPGHGADPDAGRVVRPAARRPIGRGVPGLSEALLSPDLTDDFEMIHCVFEPGAQIDTTQTRPTQEVAYLLSGQLIVTIGGARYEIAQGDSFRIRGEAFRWENPYDEAAVAIWVIAPPVY